ncbi:hypothetical protein SELMODRAFT_427438 [Selaginella moellendorffii]|uniref:DUF4864 domain-containing protein n=1 Tax=Selaginella moellendorffii TaxID=88036 RepID=D8SZM3_SELML|nr:uncharacterized protein LOC9661409 [Selaginella moellendorffii]XP_024525049.1 uncharacterized protein LOC9654851 [Selaginella moellendorffii]EFJ10047.1 hypothetical protein SELMODRAFT_427438 [Selaginella moellendorffii]|eukprot:XP_002988785.1 uncharacterized protein LOC9661409 [Selaginella moellendorffii]
MAAETSILGVEKQSLRLRGLHCEGAARIGRGIRGRGIPDSGRELVVSIEPLFFGRIMTIDSIRIHNAPLQGGNFIRSSRNFAAPSSRLKIASTKFSPGRRFVDRDFSVRASASAGPGQTQNGGGEKALPVKPDPSVTPDDVVLAQLKALRERDLATVYEFASPANKSHTGPLPRFTQMMERAYSLMIGHKDARILSSMTISPNRFQQRIVITGANGKNATFSWALSKQEEGAHEGCWMTDTVRRDD